MENLLHHPKLQQSRPDTVAKELLQELVGVKERIEQQQQEWFIVAVVHLSGDLTHSAHIALMNTIKKKMQEYSDVPCKILVWVESDERTEARKNKKNVFNEQERKYIFENLKVVDKAYIEFEHLDEQTNDKRPCWIVQYLAPDVMVSHEEHIPPEEEQQVKERLQAMWSDLVVVHYWDQEKYWEVDYRVSHNRTTTNTVKQILALYKDHPKYK